MLYPHGCTGVANETFDGDPRAAGLVAVGIEGRHPVQGPFLGVMPEVAGQQQRPEVVQVQEQRLVAGRVSGGELDDDGAVPEHVVIG